MDDIHKSISKSKKSSTVELS